MVARNIDCGVTAHDHNHRNGWIPPYRKNLSIVLPSFVTPEQFTEWFEPRLLEAIDHLLEEAKKEFDLPHPPGWIPPPTPPISTNAPPF
jgi:hypothetical protein